MLHLEKGYVNPTQYVVSEIVHHTMKVHIFEDEKSNIWSNEIQQQICFTKTEVNLLYREMKSVAQLHHVDAIKKDKGMSC